MLVVQNRLPVAEGREGEFEALFEQRTQLASEQPGFEGLELLRSVDDPSYVIQAYWDSRESFEAWRSSEAFESAHADLPADLFEGPNELRLYEVVMDLRGGHEP